MELIGFGSFFASMALWPKLFIQTPAKLIHGIDVFQEYEDSQGRKKKFFQDPQYIPWDIISDKQMDKLGDRLNIPKNVPNRSDLTKEKAHKIALQSNTMWMLSAGFGVPIMSAFICSGVEKLLPKVIDKLFPCSSPSKIITSGSAGKVTVTGTSINGVSLSVDGSIVVHIRLLCSVVPTKVLPSASTINLSPTPSSP